MAKRKAPKPTKAGILKLIRNPRTPKGLKKYWREFAKKRGWIR